MAREEEEKSGDNKLHYYKSQQYDTAEWSTWIRGANLSEDFSSRELEEKQLFNFDYCENV